MEVDRRPCCLVVSLPENNPFPGEPFATIDEAITHCNKNKTDGVIYVIPPEEKPDEQT